MFIKVPCSFGVGVGRGVDGGGVLGGLISKVTWCQKELNSILRHIYIM